MNILYRLLEHLSNKHCQACKKRLGRGELKIGYLEGKPAELCFDCYYETIPKSDYRKFIERRTGHV